MYSVSEVSRDVVREDSKDKKKIRERVIVDVYVIEMRCENE